MKTNILIVKCDRCHKETTFNCQPYTGSVIAEEWDQYNQWSTIQGIGQGQELLHADLCPTCYELIEDIIQHAMQNEFKWDRSKY